MDQCFNYKQVVGLSGILMKRKKDISGFQLAVGYDYLPAALLLLSVLFSCVGQKNTKPFIALQNPVLAQNFPDPTIIKADGKYYAYATNSEVAGATLNIQVASSTDLQNWKREGDALPQKPSWASGTQDFWAPHVLYDKDLKQYVLFYSGKSDDTTYDKCLGVAFADSPQGPFKDKGTPLLKGKGFVNIDPMAFIDPKSGKKLLYWGSGFEPIKVQQMNAGWSGFETGSKPVSVLLPGKEKKYTRLLEGAWMDYEKGTYFLYYSGDNCCGEGANYAVLVAKANNPFGPFQTKAEATGSESSAILERDSTWLAPGHNSIIRDGKKAWIAYHAIDWPKRKAGKDSGDRVMLVSPIMYRNGWPEVIKNK